MTTDPMKAVCPETPRALRRCPAPGGCCTSGGCHNMAATAPLSGAGAATLEGAGGRAQGEQRNRVPKWHQK